VIYFIYKKNTENIENNKNKKYSLITPIKKIDRNENTIRNYNNKMKRYYLLFGWSY
jgi:hypothetical protein